MNTTQTLLRAIGMGMVAGMRSMTAPAVLSHELSSNGTGVRLQNTPFAPLATPQATGILQLMALGEMVVDKLPITPSRTELPSVIFRALSGAVAGAMVFQLEGREDQVASGAVIGAAAAVGATYGAYHLRRMVGEGGLLKEPAPGFVEDAIAVGAGMAALKGIK